MRSLPMLAAFLVALVSPAAEPPEISSEFVAPAAYAGHAYVEGVGRVAFPNGHWLLEVSRTQRSPARDQQKREYFVFKRAGVEGERLTILRYNPLVAPAHMPQERYWENFRLGDGLPAEQARPDDERGDVRMRSEVKHSEDDIDVSSITAYQHPAQLWLSHIAFGRKDGWGFILVHASTALIDPAAVQLVWHDSEFTTELPESLAVLPGWMAGTWTPVKENLRSASLLHLTADGKCAVTLGSTDSLTFPAIGFYDSSARILRLGGDRYLVDENARILTTAKGSQSTSATKAGEKFKRLSETSDELFLRARESLYPMVKRD